jgi:hypothetical protein
MCSASLPQKKTPTTISRDLLLIKTVMGRQFQLTAAAQPSPICLARRGLGIPGYVNERQLCLQIGNLPINAFQLAQLRLGGL